MELSAEFHYVLKLTRSDIAAMWRVYYALYHNQQPSAEDKKHIAKMFNLLEENRPAGGWL